MQIAVILLALLPLCASAADLDGSDHSPHLLLNFRTLRRLKLDRQRQTLRWSNFENRVQSVSDSPERGFELALYYAVTQDETRGREAIQWALAHRCEKRQVALVLDWCAPLANPDERAKLAEKSAMTGCVQAGMAGTSFIPSMRDKLFLRIAGGEDVDNPESPQWKGLIALLQKGQFRDPQNLYAAVEIINAVRSATRSDIRQMSAQFFATLPVEFLLSMKPADVEHPSWKAHVAALSLVALDPNLPGSQYLQGWAMESGQTLRDGPGVAYEFLWADPYLPGIGYQNLDPWVYDAEGRVFARTDWSPGACWIGISAKGVEEIQCPAGWAEKVNQFGHMTLIPFHGSCIPIQNPKNGEASILWKLQPHQAVVFSSRTGPQFFQADGAGIWRIPGNVGGKICPASRERTP